MPSRVSVGGLGVGREQDAVEGEVVSKRLEIRVADFDRHAP